MKISKILPLLLTLAIQALASEPSAELKAAVDLFTKRDNPGAKAAFEKIVKAEPKNTQSDL